MNLLETLIHPDREENEERAEVAKAANLLQIGEFQLLQLAFHDWHKRDMPEAVIDRLFANYMLYNEVPFWARQYARKIIELDEKGELDDLRPDYHRYDVEYRTFTPDGTRKFLIAAGFIVFCIFGGILWADYSMRPGSGIFPPHVERPVSPRPMP